MVENWESALGINFVPGQRREALHDLRTTNRGATVSVREAEKVIDRVFHITGECPNTSRLKTKGFMGEWILILYSIE